MATVSITIPNAVQVRVLDAFAAVYGYGPTDGTKAEFAQRQVARFVAEVVRSHEATVAADTARNTAATKAEKEVTIT